MQSDQSTFLFYIVLQKIIVLKSLQIMNQKLIPNYEQKQDFKRQKYVFKKIYIPK